MENKTRFVQDRTFSMTFTDANATADINPIPFAVDRILFKFLGCNHNNSATLMLQSDLIYFNTIAIFQANVSANVAPINNEFVFQTPQKIGGRYNFQIKDIAGALANTINGSEITVVAQFIRD